MSQLIRRTVIFLVALLAATSASPATAQPADNVVVFGDSFAANPDQYLNTVLRFTDGSSLSSTSSERVLRNNPSESGCLHGPDNWPSQLGAHTGAAVADWSCAGITSEQMLGRIDHAVHTGALNAGTRAVTLGAGFNDHWRPLLDKPGTTYDAARTREQYLANMRAAAAKVRAAAPNAKIIIPGMLSVAGANGAICAFNVVPNLPLGVLTPTVHGWEQHHRDNQREAARQVGAAFLDINAQSTGHSTCARDADRWVAGLIDTTTAGYNMALHPSRAGSAFVAEQVARAL
ncbi:hypothetical protein HMPREF3151_01520 [Corynebacterium sp. HMSC05H05]|uniref:GDSL-type esterase/lipase family protein n=1 Tax=Corynebacterium sp. HMSC05H05 TaxID=1581119 RepID=UPI0008CD6A83|nr:GDSL-type esterase/lipase family protein [Corynebacterium sp. HMSC05H05]OFT59324.1 hypothetical protein HMPREF3151_01520 [Corynebacterium sp. HMSC05H05]